MDKLFYDVSTVQCDDIHDKMNEWGCGLYDGAGYLLTFVSFCDKNMVVRVIVRKIWQFLCKFAKI